MPQMRPTLEQLASWDDSTVTPEATHADALAQAERIAWAFASWPGLAQLMPLPEKSLTAARWTREAYWLAVLADLLEQESGELVAMLAHRAALVPRLRTVAAALAPDMPAPKQ